jgi:hypothetical protein
MRIYCIVCIAFVTVLWIVAGNAHADGYVGGNLGLALFSNGGPREYLTHNDVGVRRTPGDSNQLQGAFLAGFWFSRVFGIELGGEIGPYANGTGSVEYAPGQSASYEERLEFMSMVLGPKARWELLPPKLDLVMGIPVGIQYGSAQILNTDYTASNWSLLYGVNARLDLALTKVAFSYFSLGYEFSKLGTFHYSYPKDWLGGGSSRPYDNLGPGLNRNSGVDLSGIRLSIGIGFRWGLRK